VTFAWDVGRHLDAVGQTDAGHLPEGRVRLLGAWSCRRACTRPRFCGLAFRAGLLVLLSSLFASVSDQLQIVGIVSSLDSRQQGPSVFRCLAPLPPAGPAGKGLEILVNCCLSVNCLRRRPGSSWLSPSNSTGPSLRAQAAEASPPVVPVRPQSDDKCLAPVPAGISRPTITFSLRPYRSSIRPGHRGLGQDAGGLLEGVREQGTRSPARPFGVPSSTGAKRAGWPTEFSIPLVLLLHAGTAGPCSLEQELVSPGP